MHWWMLVPVKPIQSAWIPWSGGLRPPRASSIVSACTWYLSFLHDNKYKHRASHIHDLKIARNSWVFSKRNHSSRLTLLFCFTKNVGVLHRHRELKLLRSCLRYILIISRVMAMKLVALACRSLPSSVIKVHDRVHNLRVTLRQNGQTLFHKIWPGFGVS